MNPHEKLARAAKVHALLEFIPLGQTAEANARVAATLAGWAQVDRDRFAKGHRINSPSVETWEALCASVRAREVGR